jgi:class 3 adenylate cyclase
VIGDTANLAARLQGLAERGTVIVAGFTCRLLGDECLSRSATLLLLPSNRV